MENEAETTATEVRRRPVEETGRRPVKETGRRPVEDMLQLHGSDYPGMVVVSAPPTGNNFLTWSHAIKRALCAKMKLGFIDGTAQNPDANDETFEQWIRVDSMVTTWILKSISKDIVEGFMYTKSARSLWLDLEERYGECNGPLLYQLQHEITSLAQGNMSVVAYYTKLKKLWDEMTVLMPTPHCTCGVSKAISDLSMFTQLIQFLMGLSDDFDHVRNQLLVMDPVPTVNKAYSMVLRVEKQRQVHMEMSDTTDNVALQIRTSTRRETGLKGRAKKKGFIDKRNLFCDCCNKPGHTRDTCFKLHGTPDWYRELVEQ